MTLRDACANCGLDDLHCACGSGDCKCLACTPLPLEEYPDWAKSAVYDILQEFGSDGLTELVSVIAAEEMEDDVSGGRVWERLAERMKG